MAFKLADRVKQTSTSTGTGNFTFSATPAGFRAFSSVLSVNDTLYYTIAHQTANEWEVGYGTYSSANTLTRSSVISSSNSNSAVNFSAGTKDVFITLPAVGTSANNIVFGSNITYDQSTNSESVVIGTDLIGGNGANVIIGPQADATGGSYSVAVGRYARAQSNGVTAVGNGASGYSSDSVAVGVNCTAQQSAVTVGGNAYADGYSVAVGNGAYSSFLYSVTVGTSSSANHNNSIVVGYGSTSSSSGPEIRVGTNHYPAGTGYANILIGNDINTSSSNPSGSIVIGNSISVAQTGATYMNQFRIDPTTGLVGPEYSLSWDSTTKEVYATTGGPAPPGGFDWVTYQVGSPNITGTITPPTNYTTSPAGPAYAVIAGAPQYGWSSISPSWSLGYDGGWSWPSSEEFWMPGMNWLSTTTPFSYMTSPPATDGLVVTYVVYPAGHSSGSFQNIWGNYSSWTGVYGVSTFYLSSYPASGSSKKMYGVLIFDNGDIATTISSNPGFASITFEANYSSYVNATLVVFEITSDSDVSSILGSGATLFAWPSPLGNVFGHIWYEYI